MGGQAIPYDPYEEKRRRLLAMGIPSPQDVPAFLPPAPTASQLGPMPLAPEQERYRDVLAQQPTREEHAPGVLRKILASAVGGATGWRAGGPAGIEAGRRITDLPYERATADWRERLQAAMAPMELEGARRAEEREIEQLGLQRREVGARETEARTRGGYYGAMQERAQRPETTLVPPGYGAMRAGEPEPFYTQPPRPSAPTKPMGVPPGGTVVHPETGEVIYVAPPKSDVLSPEAFSQRRELATAPSKAAAEHRVGRQPDVDELQDAQEAATMHVMQAHPEYEEFFKSDEGGIFHTVKPEAGWDEATKLLYNQMLADIEAEKEATISRLYGGQSQGGTPGYSVEEVRD